MIRQNGLVFMCGILAKAPPNKLFILSPVPLFKAWRIHSFPKVALGSLAFSRYLLEGFKKVYSNRTRESFKSALANIYSKAKGWSGLIKRLIEIIVLVLLVPVILFIIFRYGDEGL
jgi:hypothetical protein